MGKLDYGTTIFSTDVVNPARWPLIRELGGFMRMPFPMDWVIDPDGQPTGTVLARAVMALAGADLPVLGILTDLPAWAKRDGRPHGLELFGKYARACAERYPWVREWQVLPEPDHEAQWGVKGGNPVEYVDFLRVAYETMKWYDQDLTIVFGAPSGDMTPFYTAAYAQEAKLWFDVASFHTYKLMSGKNTGAKKNDYLALQQLEARYSDSTIPTYLTETGWSSIDQGLEKQAHFVEEKMSLELPKWASLTRAYLFCLFDPEPGHPSDGYGIVGYDNKPKPAYEVYRGIIHADA